MFFCISEGPGQNALTFIPFPFKLYDDAGDMTDYIDRTVQRGK